MPTQTTPNKVDVSNSGNSANIWERGFLLQVLHVWRSVFQDKGVLTMLLIAPVIYGF